MAIFRRVRRQDSQSSTAVQGVEIIVMYRDSALWCDYCGEFPRVSGLRDEDLVDVDAQGVKTVEVCHFLFVTGGLGLGGDTV